MEPTIGKLAKFRRLGRGKRGEAVGRGSISGKGRMSAASQGEKARENIWGTLAWNTQKGWLTCVSTKRGWKWTLRMKVRDANVGRKALLSTHRVSSGLCHIPEYI